MLGLVAVCLKKTAIARPEINRGGFDFNGAIRSLQAVPGEIGLLSVGVDPAAGAAVVIAVGIFTGRGRRGCLRKRSLRRRRLVSLNLWISLNILVCLR